MYGSVNDENEFSVVGVRGDVVRYGTTPPVYHIQESFNIEIYALHPSEYIMKIIYEHF